MVNFLLGEEVSNCQRETLYHGCGWLFDWLVGSYLNWWVNLLMHFRIEGIFTFVLKIRVLPQQSQKCLIGDTRLHPSLFPGWGLRRQYRSARKDSLREDN
jgi:hypothetical protein